MIIRAIYLFSGFPMIRRLENMSCAVQNCSCDQSHYRKVMWWEIFVKNSENWDGFRPDGNTDKKNRADYKQILRAFFSGAKNIVKVR